MRERVVAGLQTGMLGALVMLGWMTLAMLWVHHSVWWFPNLMATTFGGDPALQQSFGKYTASGLALHLMQYSLLGAAFALVAPVFGRPRSSRLFLAGLVVGIAWYYFMYGLVWKNLNPLISLYSPDRAILVAHVAYGVTLSRLPRYLSARTAPTE